MEMIGNYFDHEHFNVIPNIKEIEMMIGNQFFLIRVRIRIIQETNSDMDRMFRHNFNKISYFVFCYKKNPLVRHLKC